jgi:hypothetical protein
MTARPSVIIMPIGSVEGITRARKERAPRHTGQVVDVLDGIALVGLMDRRTFKLRTEIARISFGAIRAARTTLRKDQVLPFERGDQLIGQIHNDAFFFVRHIRR